MSERTYLGDGVYAEFDGEHIVLLTDDGFGVTNHIFLDQTTMAGLFQYLERKWNVRVNLERNEEGREAV